VNFQPTKFFRAQAAKVNGKLIPILLMLVVLTGLVLVLLVDMRRGRGRSVKTIVESQDMIQGRQEQILLKLDEVISITKEKP
jgi:hypothetical protein